MNQTQDKIQQELNVQLANLNLQIALLEGEAWAIKHVLDQREQSELIEKVLGTNSMVDEFLKTVS